MVLPHLHFGNTEAFGAAYETGAGHQFGVKGSSGVQRFCVNVQSGRSSSSGEGSRSSKVWTSGVGERGGRF